MKQTFHKQSEKISLKHQWWAVSQSKFQAYLEVTLHIKKQTPKFISTIVIYYERPQGYYQQKRQLKELLKTLNQGTTSTV